MRSGMRRVVLALVAFSIGSGAAVGQADGESQLKSWMRQSEAAVHSPAGKADGVVWLHLAVLYQDAARYKDAEHAFREAVGLLKGKDRTMYAGAMDQMGTMYVELGKFAKAALLEQKALAIRQQGNDEIGIGVSYMHLSLIAYGEHDLSSAETDAEMAVSLLSPEHADETRASGATPEEQMGALVDLSLIRCAAGKCAATVADINRALRLAHAHYEANSVPVGTLDFLLGNAYWKSGNAKQAPELMKRGIDEMEPQLGWGHPTFIAALKQYRSVLAATGKTAEADEVAVQLARVERSSERRVTPGGNALLGVNALR